MGEGRHGGTGGMVPLLTSRQWIALLTGGFAASLAVIAGWGAGWGGLQRGVIAACVGLLTFLAQFVVSYKSNSRRRLSAPPSQIPRPLPQFTGRASDLQVLRERYGRQRAVVSRHTWLRVWRKRSGARSEAIGPTLILIDGKAGLGKSALARQFANELISDFPDGQLYANLGYGGASRPAGEVLGEFLLALGYKPKAGSKRREKVYRAATARRRILIFLDAVRDAQQLEKLLPNEAACCVIVTSRRALSADVGTSSHHLGLPGTSDSLEMLSAFAERDWRREPECAAELLDVCGRLPLALRSIGEQVREKKLSLREMADRLLSEEDKILSNLTYGGLDVEECIASEYEKLTFSEKRSLRMLSLVDSVTFIPWVLRPLLNIEVTEAENLVAQLAEAELLEVAGPDSPLGPSSPLGVARYRFHPLVRLFARARLEVEDEATAAAAARKRLDAAYLELIGRVLALDPHIACLPGFQTPQAVWLPADSTLPERISRLPSHWVRADYKDWMRACVAAYEERQWALCWRISTFLGGPVPDRPDLAICRRVFETAQEAASHDHDPLASIEVILAKGTFMLALERYREAGETFDAAERMISVLKANATYETSAVRLQAVRHRKIAEGWIQLAAYGRARNEIAEALSLSGYAHDAIEADRTLLLQADNDARLKLDHRYVVTSRAASLEADDAIWFRDHLMQSDYARRSRKWQLAERYLRDALRQNYGDARRIANIRYRFARLRLNQSSHTSGSEAEKDRLLWESVGYAAASLNSFRAMGNRMGVVRARCLLARALAATGRLFEAEEELRIAKSELTAAVMGESKLANPLGARIKLAEGEVCLRQQRFDEASRVLAEAVAGFAEESDRWSQVEALLLRGVAERRLAHFANANMILWSVAAAFRCSGDYIGLARVLEELALTAESMGQFSTAVELRRLTQYGSVKHLSSRLAVAFTRSIYSPHINLLSGQAVHDEDVHLPV